MCTVYAQTPLIQDQITSEVIDLEIDNPNPGRDEIGDNWITYDEGDVASMTIDENYWSKVIFTPENQYILKTIQFMPMNVGPNLNAPCFLRVYSLTVGLEDLDEMLYEYEFESLEPWNENIADNWITVELPEEDWITFQTDEKFAVMFGPAPGGPLRVGEEGAGWWNVIDSDTETYTSFVLEEQDGEPVAIHRDWNVLEGDLLIRVNGSFEGGVLRWDPNVIDFGEVQRGESHTVLFTFGNDGNENVTIISAHVNGVCFSENFENQIVVEPGAEREIEVTFTPEQFGLWEGLLTIRTDDPEFNLINIELTGNGIITLEEINRLEEAWGTRLSVSGNHAFITSMRSLKVIDISNIENPEMVTTEDEENIIRGFALEGNYAYLATETLLKIFDISTPEDPQVVGIYDAPEHIRSCDVQGSFAYISLWRNGLQVISLFDKTNPVLAGWYEDDIVILSIEVRGDYAYLGSQGRMYVMDVSDPQNLQIVRQVNGVNNAMDVSLHGDYAHVTSSNLEILNSTSIIDISNPENPEVLGSYFTPGQQNFSVAASYDYSFTCGWEGLFIADVSHPLNPFVIGYVDIGFEGGSHLHDIVLMGEYALAVSGQEGLIVYNTSELQLLDQDIQYGPSFFEFGPVMSGESEEQVLTISNQGVEELTVFDVSSGGGFFDVNFENEFTLDPFESSELIVTYSPLTLGRHSGSILIESDDPNERDALLPLDGICLTEFEEVGLWSNDNYIEEVVVQGDFAYVIEAYYGLRIISIVQDHNPVVVGSVPLRGFARRLFVDGDYCYVTQNGERTGFSIIDVSIPGEPEEIAFINREFGANEFLVQGNHLFVSESDRYYSYLIIFDIENPHEPQEIASYQMMSTCLGMVIEDDVLFAAAGWFGFEIIDVSDFENPSLIGFSRMQEFWGEQSAIDIKVANGFAYVADDSAGVYSFDVSNPEHPVQLDRISTRGRTRSLSLFGDFLFTTEWEEGVRIIDVSDPNDLAEIATHDTPHQARSNYTLDGRLYVADSEGGLRIFDVSEFFTEGPRITSVNGMGFGQVGINQSRTIPLEIRNDGDMNLEILDIRIDGNYFSADFDGELVIEPGNTDQINIRFSPEEVGEFQATLRMVTNDPENGTHFVEMTGYGDPISLIAGYNTPGFAARIEVQGNYAFVSDQGGLFILDVSTPQNPDSVSYINTNTPVKGVDIVDNLLYLANHVGGLRIIDITNPHDTQILTTFDTPGTATDVDVVGNFAYIADYQTGLIILDISDPQNPQEVDRLDTPGNANGVVVSGDYAFIADKAAGLRIIDVSDPQNLDEIGFYDTPSIANGVVVDGNIAYVADGQDGLLIIDVSDPENPDLLGSIDTEVNAENVFVVDGLAFVADNTDLLVIDVLVPDDPILLGSFETAGFAKDVVINNEIAYVADHGGGLQILDVSYFFREPEGSPILAVQPESLDFGEVLVGEAGELPLTITNEGDARAIISEITIAGDWFGVGFENEIVFNPGTSIEVMVVFTPEMGGNFEGGVTIISNDPEHGEIIVPLTGTGIGIPDIEVDPLGIFANGSGDHIFTILNNGSADLEWTTDVEYFDDMRDRNPRRVRGVNPDNNRSSARNQSGSENQTISTIPITNPSPEISSRKVRSINNNGHPDSGSESAFISKPVYNQIIPNRDDDVEWISWEPAEGVIRPRESTEFVISLNAENLDAGMHRAVFHVLSNDPDDRDVEIQIMLEVEGFPEISVVPAEINFGEILINEVADATFKIHNLGNAGLIVFGIQSVGDQFTVRFPGELFIAPRDSVQISVLFSSQESGIFEGLIEIRSNDPDNEVVNINLTGTALEEWIIPEINVQPEALNFGEVEVNHTEDLILAIENLGNGDLIISDIDIEGAYFWSNFEAEITIPPEEMSELIVTFGPDEIRDYEATLSIHSNDPENNILSVLCSGIGIEEREHLIHELGFFDTDGFANDVSIDGQFAYVADGEEGMAKIDVSNPEEPELIDTFWHANQDMFNYRSVITDENYIWTVNEFGVKIFDKERLALIRYFNTEGTAMKVSAAFDHVFISDFIGGFGFIDPSFRPQDWNLRMFENRGRVTGVSFYNRNIGFVSKGATGIATTVFQWRMDGDLNLLVTGEEVFNYNTPGEANDVAVFGDHLFVPCGEGGIQIYSLETPTRPEHIGELDTRGSALAISFEQDLAFIADHSNGLIVVDVSDPANPEVVEIFDTPGSAINVEIFGGYAFIADGESGLRILDVSAYLEQPVINVQPDALNFGEVEVYQTGELILTIENLGNDDLIISDVNIEGDYFASEFDAEITIPPGEANELTVIFTPEEISDFEGEISITSNDPWNEVVTIPLSGTGFGLPDIEINPMEINTQDSGDHIISISNVGIGDLNWSTEIEYVENNRDQNLRQVRGIINQDSEPTQNIESRISQQSPYRDDEAEWITWEPAEGGLRLNETVDITVTINTDNMENGTYNAVLHVLSDDPDEGDVGIDIVLEVQRFPSIVVEPNLINFGEVIIEERVEDSFKIHNIGDADLLVPEIRREGDYFTVDFPEGITIAPGDSTDISVFFTPGEVGELWGWLGVVSNDPDREVVSVELYGDGLNEPLMEEIGFFDTPGSALDVKVAGGKAFVADSSEGLRIIEITTPEDPADVGNHDTESIAAGIAVSGDFAYIADNADGLRIIDISDPTNPEEVSFYDTPGHAVQVVVEGEYAFVADLEYDLNVINISNPEEAEAADYLSLRGNAYGIAIDNGFVYMACGVAGLGIIDTNNPEQVEEVAFFYTEGFARSVSIMGNLAYVANGPDGLVVIDISDPENPREVGSFEGEGHYYDISVIGDYAFVIELSIGLVVIDISDLENIQFVERFRSPGTAYRIDIIGDYAYVADGTNGLRVIDVSAYSDGFTFPNIEVQPEALSFGAVHPNQTAELTLTIGNSGNDDLVIPEIAVEGNYFEIDFIEEVTLLPGDIRELVVGFAPEEAGEFEGTITIISNDPENGEVIVAISGFVREVITEIGSVEIPHYAGGVDAAGNYAFVIAGNSGLRVIDVFNPEDPVEISSLELEGFPRDITVVGNYAYLADGDYGLRVIDVSDPENPDEIGFFDTPDFAENVEIVGNLAYLADRNSGLRVIDVSNPEEPHEVRSIYPGAPIRDVAVQDDYAYASCGHYGLVLIDLPMFVYPVFEIQGVCNAIDISGNYVYLDNGGLSVIDVSSPRFPELVGFYDTPAFPTDLLYSRDHVYISEGEDGLIILDVSNPAEPDSVGSFDTPGSVLDLDISKGLAYVADGEEGLRILDVSMFYYEEAVPAIAISNESMEFNEVLVGSEEEMLLEIRNSGFDQLTVTNIAIEGPYYSANFDQEFTLAPREIYGTLVTFAPEDIGEFEGAISITSNDPLRESVTVNLRGSGFVYPDIATQPADGETITVEMNPGDNPVARQLIIQNTAIEGARDLDFITLFNNVEQGRDMGLRRVRSVKDIRNYERIGPERDIGGDIVNSYRIPYLHTSDLTWDGELMWGICSGDHLVGIDPSNGNIAYDWELPEHRDIVAFDGENLIISSTTPEDHNLIEFHSLEGDILDVIDFGQANMLGFTVDPDGYLYISIGDGRSGYFHVFNLDNFQFIADMDYRHLTGEYVGSIAWAQEHVDGHLWAMGQDCVYQFEIDEEWNVSLVSFFDWDTEDRNNVGLAHDGANLWHGMRNQRRWYIHDDGVAEIPSWLQIEPRYGSVMAGEEIPVNLIFDAQGLEPGTRHFIDLIVASNDPDESEIVIHIELQVGEFERDFELRHFTDFVNTDQDHSVLITSMMIDDELVSTGCEVGAFTPDGTLAGAGIWTQDENLGFPVWGAEQDLDNGFHNGELMSFVIWDFEIDVEYSTQVVLINGSREWEANGFSVMELLGAAGRIITVSLMEGWNTISINVSPPEEMWNRDEGPDVELMLEQLRVEEENHNVLIFKNGSGNFYIPNFGFNNIAYWNLLEGYKIKVTESLETSWSGDPIPAESDIQLNQNWNMVSYLPTYELDASAPDFYVVSSILDNLIIAKDGSGRFLMPAFDFSSMRPWRESQGYIIKVDSDVIMNYPAEREEGVMAARGRDDNLQLPRFADFQTEENMSLLVLPGDAFVPGSGDEILAFSSKDKLVGSGVVQTEGRCGLAVWADDESTDEVDGLTNNEGFRLVYRNSDDERIENLILKFVVEGSGLVYKDNSLSVVEVGKAPEIPDNYYLAQNHPNPFNSLTKIRFGLPESQDLSINIYDISGRMVENLTNRNFEAGHHTLTWNANEKVAGLYLVRISSNNFNAVRKMVLIK